MLRSQTKRMSDGELSERIRQMIFDREPESLRLDYKQALSLKRESDRKELAKDVSSFANEQGGTLIYGVPEERDGELPRPKPLTECGMDIDARLPEQVENILISTTQPPLHALDVRIVDIAEIAPKQLLVIHHPESYWKPHMVESYGDRRYYRRGNFRVVEMCEREVEAAYLAREASRTHAQKFLDTGLFGIPHSIEIRAVACPVLPQHYKHRMLIPVFRHWLDANPPPGPDYPRAGTWIPFLDGWRFLAVPEGSISGRQYEIRVFHNGAVCLRLDPTAHILEQSTIMLDRLQRDLTNLFVLHAGAVFSGLGVSGPIVIRFSLFYADGMEAAPIAEVHRERCRIRSEISQHGSALVGRSPRRIAPVDPGRPYEDASHLVFEEESSVEEITDQAEQLTSRLMTRIAMGFGLRGDEQYEA